jgi:3-deoxy-D-manno-octulosonic-acid transferase
VAASEPLLRFGAGAPTLVAGSTWAADEVVLLSAFARVRARHPDARLVLVPHEPTGEHLAALDRRAAGLGLHAPTRLSAADGPAPLLVVDRVGALATLYGAGTMAYVGGGYGRAGLHSVLEPAAWGVPVAFGPRWHESREAALLLEGGVAEALGGSGETGIASMVKVWEGWLTGEDRRREAGARAREIVTRGLGAARRSAEMLAELISSRPPRR